MSCNGNTKTDTKPTASLSDNDIVLAIRNLEEVEWSEASSRKDKAWVERHLADSLVMTTGRM
jgi:hypothetical protein